MEYPREERNSTTASGTYFLKDEDIDQDSDDDLTETIPISHRRNKNLKSVIAISLAVAFTVGVAVTVLVLVVNTLSTASPQSLSFPVTQNQSVSPTLLPVMPPSCGDESAAVVCLNLGGSGCKKMLIGSKENDIFIFKGIAYGNPPVSENRWKQPTPANSSCEPLLAQSYGSKCLQLGSNGTGFEGSEDCLYLNIWTPSINTDANLHVMVYFHSGSLISGSGNENGFIPTSQLVLEANMVFVTFNYRLNVFGFLALPSMNVDGTAAGNYGIMDQVLALRWVQTNIRNFGGSPKKVTVFGHGSGATSIYALLASEASGELFQKAWLSSPSPKLDTSLAEVYEQNAEFLNNTECNALVEDQLKCLQNLTEDEVLSAVPGKSWKNLHLYQLPQKTEKTAVLAIIDGKFLKSPPVEVWKKKKSIAVPLLIGSAAQGTDIHMLSEKLVSWSWYNDYVRQLMLPFDHVNVSEVLSLYSHYESPEQSITSMVSDMRAICPVDEMAKVAASAMPVYRYLVSYHSRPNHGTSGVVKNYAYSGIDVEGFFNVESTAPSSADHNNFVRLIRDVVFDFVHNSSVSGWNMFPVATYNISTTVEQIPSRFKSVECNFWRTQSFFPRYAWMN